jgi:hypothetical protein
MPSGILLTFGIGVTVMVNVAAVPVDGVTVIVAVTGEPVGLTAVKGAIFPVPFAPRPIVVLLFVQVKVVPETVLEKTIVFVVAPLHTVTLSGCMTLKGEKRSPAILFSSFVSPAFVVKAMLIIKRTKRYIFLIEKIFN